MIDAAESKCRLATVRQLRDGMIKHPQYVRQVCKLFIRVVDPSTKFEEMIRILATNDFMADVVEHFVLDDTIEIRS